MRTTMQLTEDNAGAVREWCASHDDVARAVLRGGPGGGSKGAQVIVVKHNGDRFSLLPGDTAQNMAGVGLVLREGDRP